MEQPWEYIKSLQSSFDYSKIKYTKEYYDMDMNPAAEPTAPEWKVYFDGTFWGHQGKDRAGKEIPIGKQFEWAGHHWLIPAAYSCSKGLVVDFCMRVEADEIRAFMKSGISLRRTTRAKILHVSSRWNWSRTILCVFISIHDWI